MTPEGIRRKAYGRRRDGLEKAHEAGGGAESGMTLET